MKKKYNSMMEAALFADDDESIDINTLESDKDVEPTLEEQITKLKAENEKMKEKLDSIERWCVAYPQDMFIGETFDLARHILKGVAKLAKLKSLEDKG